jgi:hypothetical protein
MLFDLPPGELPRATLRPRRSRGQMSVWSGDFDRWLGARWTWLRPRVIPVLVAVAGMFAVIASANYLRTFAQRPPERLVVHTQDIVVAPPSATVATVWVETGPAGVQLLMDREPVTQILVRSHDGTLRPIPLAPGRNIIRLEPMTNDR